MKRSSTTIFHFLYVAGHDVPTARAAADRLRSVGHKVLSTWHDEEDQLTPVEATDEEMRELIALRDTAQIRRASGLVLLADEGMVPGGKFVELGFALGLGKVCYIVGRRENMLCYHPSLIKLESVEHLLGALL